MNDSEIKDLCAIIRDTSLNAHRYLPHGHNEKIYENSLAHRLRKQGLDVVQQHPLVVRDEDDFVLGDFYADLLVEKELLVELKALRTLSDEHVSQVLGYLRSARREHSMLINFGAPIIQFRKFILRDDTLNAPEALS